MMENQGKALEGNDLSCGERKARVIPVFIGMRSCLQLIPCVRVPFYLAARLAAFLQVLRGLGRFSGKDCF